MRFHVVLTGAPIVEPKSISDTEEVGAELDFRGIVRVTEKGHSIAGMNYEAYEPMAVSKLEEQGRELAEKHGCLALWIIHRTGFVPVGECSLFIRSRTRHRGSSFLLVSELIDRIKQDVPIWKSPVELAQTK